MPFGFERMDFNTDPDEQPTKRRRYVEVKAKVLKDGTIIPLSITWDNGFEYPIDRIINRYNGRSLKYKTSGMRFRCRSDNKDFYLYLDGRDRWYVEIDD